MHPTLDRTYLGCSYLPFMQPVSVSDLWDQLGFLVTKILGGDSHSNFPLIRDKNILSPHIFHMDKKIESNLKVDDRRDAVHVRQYLWGIS
jgi:hypothetical protein